MGWGHPSINVFWNTSSPMSDDSYEKFPQLSPRRPPHADPMPPPVRFVRNRSDGLGSVRPRVISETTPVDAAEQQRREDELERFIALWLLWLLFDNCAPANHVA
jgi:hypothetical protein